MIGSCRNHRQVRWFRWIVTQLSRWCTDILRGSRGRKFACHYEWCICHCASVVWCCRVVACVCVVCTTLCSVWTVCVYVVGEVCVVISQTENSDGPKLFLFSKIARQSFFSTKERTSHMEQKRKACHIPQTFVNSMRNFHVDRKKGWQFSCYAF